MSRIAQLPLLPAASVAVGLSLLDGAAPLAALGAAAIVAIGTGGLALLSADRMRRLAWIAATVTGIALALRVVVPPVAGPDLVAFIELRSVLGEPLRRLVPEPESGILLGIALGDRASVTAELAYAFARSGTSHLLAISGFNMTLVAAAVGSVLRGRAGPRLRSVAVVARIA